MLIQFQLRLQSSLVAILLFSLASFQVVASYKTEGKGGKKSKDPVSDTVILQRALNAGLRSIIQDGSWKEIQESFFGSSPDFPPGGCTEDGMMHHFPSAEKMQKYLDAGKIVFAYKMSPPRVGFADDGETLTGNIVETARATVEKIGQHYGVTMEAEFQLAANGNGYFEDFLVSLVDIGPLDGADVALGPLSYTDARAQYVHYTCSFTTINFSFVRSGLDPSIVVNGPADLAGLTVSTLAGSTEERFLQELSDTLSPPINIIPLGLASDVLGAASQGATSTVHAALLNTPAALTYAQESVDTCECFALDFELLDDADADRIAFATSMTQCMA